MPFHSDAWSAPHKINTSYYDPAAIVNSWQACKTKGIYVIRDEFDTRTLYVGKAEQSVQGRLAAHFTDKSNAGIGNLSQHQQTFTVRWAASKNPGLSEGIAIAQLSPLFNKRRELADIKKTNPMIALQEIGRLGLSEVERPDAIPAYEQANADKITTWMEEIDTNGNGVAQDHVHQYPSHIAQDKMQEVRNLLPESSPTFQGNDAPAIDGPTSGRS